MPKKFKKPPVWGVPMKGIRPRGGLTACRACHRDLSDWFDLIVGFSHFYYSTVHMIVEERFPVGTFIIRCPCQLCCGVEAKVSTVEIVRERVLAGGVPNWPKDENGEPL